MKVTELKLIVVITRVLRFSTGVLFYVYLCGRDSPLLVRVGSSNSPTSVFRCRTGSSHSICKVLSVLP